MVRREMSYLAAFFTALLFMVIVTPKLRALAYKTNYLEQPRADSERKIHKEPKPYLAAVGMFVIFWIVYLVFTKDLSSKTLYIFVSSVLIFGIGMVDDWFKIRGKDLQALPKLLIQVVACLIAYIGGVEFVGFTSPTTGGYILLPAFCQLLLTVLWLFGVTTVINFTDGMDGLAGGISCISACTLFVVALMKGNTTAAFMGIILVGICLGYLKYNHFPAKILMGDAGATFLGFMLAIISLDGAFKQATLISILVPVLALGVPIFDNIYVVYKRLKEKKPIYIGDSSQAHFRLVAQGLTQKQAVYFLYLISLCFNLSAIILFMLRI